MHGYHFTYISETISMPVMMEVEVEVEAGLRGHDIAK